MKVQGKDVCRLEPGYGRALGGTSLLLSLTLALSLTACTRTRVVSIPPEWKSPPPQADAALRKGGDASYESGVQQPPGAVLKSGPGFKERDLPSTAESPASPGSMKKIEPVSPREQAPQRMASMHLVDQGKASLTQGKPDAAIPMFEQAIQVDVHNGDAFFGLAKAWRMKGSRNKAQEFARKAEILFQDNPDKLKEVLLFQADLFKELGDTKKMELYREKASKL